MLVSILGLLGKDTSQKLLDNVQKIAPGGVRNFLNTVLGQAQSRGAGLASIGAIVGVVVALWSASGYVSAFMRAANVIFGVGEGRTFVKKTGTRLGVTIAAVVILLVCAVIVVFTGPLASGVGKALGLGNSVVLVWEIVKWPVLVVLISMLFALLYWAAPNVKQPGIKWVSPGGLVAVIVWALASGLFAVYLTTFASYNKTYGSLAGIVIALVWIWLTNFAILLGLEFNAETIHAKAVAAGLPEDVEPYVQLRDTAKLDPQERQDLEEAQQAQRHVEQARTQR